MKKPLPFCFDDSNNAISITDPRLPGPWINYLSNGQIHALASQAGGGFVWWRSPLTYRLTRYRHHHQPIDSPGFYVYLREEDGEVWSPAFRPCERTDTQPEATHQPGMTTYIASYRGVTARLQLWVLPDHDVLCWDLSLDNHCEEKRVLDVFAYTELSQHQWMEENRFGYYIRNMVKGWFDNETASLKFLYHEPNQPKPKLSPLVTFAATEPVASYTLHRDRFFGPYGSERLPQAVVAQTCRDEALPCGEGCFALHHRIEINRGTTHRMSWFLSVQTGGLTDFEEAERQHALLLPQLCTPAYLAAQREKLNAWWQEHLSTLQVKVADPVVQRSINVWTPVNTVQTSRYSRAVNALASGIRAVGYRDTAQDMLAMAYRKPQWALQSLKELLSHQLADGHALHAYSLEGDLPPTDSLHCDNHLWPPLLAYAIAAELGQARFLGERVPYYENTAKSGGKEVTLWEHLLQGIRFTQTNLGVHKLPLTFKGDWNDIIGKFSRAGKGESVFAAQQYCVALQRLIALAEFTGREEDAAWLTDCKDHMEEALLEHAWDGRWWARGFDDDGMAVGAQARSFGQIFLNPQSWAVLAAVGSDAQLRQGMDAAQELLDTGFGLKAMAPGFLTYPDETDPFAGYGPGCGENGSVFCHANTWAIIAECMLRRPEKAWKYYTQLIPENLVERFGVERYEAEPYAWMSMVTGPENARYGWGNTVHISGTAAWMDVAATQYLLGIRPELAGLRFDPCLPSDSPGFQATRQYAGATLEIDVSRSSQADEGITAASLNGQALPVNGHSILIPRKMFEAGSRYRIHLSC